MPKIQFEIRLWQSCVEFNRGLIHFELGGFVFNLQLKFCFKKYFENRYYKENKIVIYSTVNKQPTMSTYAKYYINKHKDYLLYINTFYSA